jgi:hypothetical protein
MGIAAKALPDPSCSRYAAAPELHAYLRKQSQHLKDAEAKRHRMAEAGKQRATATPNEGEGEGDKQPWDRIEGENNLWYERFLVYLKLGPRRSVSLASRGKRNAYPIPSHWMIVARQNNWRERAAAYDRAHGLADELEEQALD